MDKDKELELMKNIRCTDNGECLKDYINQKVKEARNQAIEDVEKMIKTMFYRIDNPYPLICLDLFLKFENKLRELKKCQD